MSLSKADVAEVAVHMTRLREATLKSYGKGLIEAEYKKEEK